MSSSTTKSGTVNAVRVVVTSDTLTAELTDGRTVSVPLAWFPRLVHGNVQERLNWRLIGSGVGIHWPDLDEDISVANLLLGQPSSESQTSLRNWLDSRPSTQSAAQTK